MLREQIHSLTILLNSTVEGATERNVQDSNFMISARTVFRLAQRIPSPDRTRVAYLMFCPPGLLNCNTTAAL